MPLDTHLSTLEAADLIRLAQIEPELEYLFRHAMLQDAAYDSLLRLDRKRLHRDVGHALETLYPDRRTELAAELARHFECGDDPAQALDYYRIAADQNAAQFALPEAVEQYTRAIELIPAFTAEQCELIKHLYLKRGRSLELLGDYHAAMDGYAEMERLAEQTAHDPLILAALMAKAILFATGNPLHDGDQAMAVGDRSLRMARALGDRAAEARSLWILSLAHYYGLGDLTTAAEIGEQALALAREVGATEQIAFTLGDLATIYSFSGRLSEARAYVAETIDLWNADNNLPMVASNLCTAARLAELAGDLDEALRLSEDAQLIAETVGNSEGVLQALIVKVTAHLNKGEIGAALDAHQSILFEQGTFGGYGKVMGLIFPLRAYAELGWIDKTREVLQALANTPAMRDLRPGAAAYQLSSWVRAEAAIGEPGMGTALWEQTFGDTSQLTPPHRLPTLEVQLLRGEVEQALAGAEEFLQAIWWMGHRAYLWDGLRVKAKALIALRRFEDAWGVLHMAREDAEGMDAKLTLWQIHALLAEVEAGLDHAAEAAEERASAMAYAQHIADSLDDPDLRRAFLENAVNSALWAQ